MQKENIIESEDFKRFKKEHEASYGFETNLVCEGREGEDTRLILIDGYEKRPTMKGWINKIPTYEEIATHNGNFGLITGWNHDKNGYSLACIDIDGLTDDEGNKIKSVSKYLFNCLFKHLKNDPRFEIHKSPNGYHIFCWNKTQADFPSDEAHYISKHLKFPNNLPDDLKAFEGKPLDNSIEIFTKPNRQIIAGGSYYQDKKYQVFKTGVICQSSIWETHWDNSVEDVNEYVKKVLIEEGFTYVEEKKQNIPSSNVPNSYTLPENRVGKSDKKKQEIANLVVETLQIMQNGGKDNCMIAWAGFFGRNLTWEDASDILERVINHPKRPSFKSIQDCRNHFKTSYEKGKNPNNANITGLPKIKEYLKDFGKSDAFVEGFDFRIRKLVYDNFVKRIKGNVTSNYGQDWIVLDYGNQVIRKESTKKKTAKQINDERELLLLQGKDFDNINPYTTTREIELFFGTIDEISILRSVIGENQNSMFKINYTPNNEISKKVKGTDFEKLTNQIIKNDGVQGAKEAFLKVKSYFKKTGITKTECDVPCPGLFLNPVTDELVRSRGDGVVDINYEKPSQQQVKEALELMREFYDYYKGDKDNFVAVMRWCLLAPFSYIFKTRFLNPIKSLFLYGVSDTGKTALARIGALMWTPIDSTTNTSGDNISTPWRLANTMEQNGGLVIVDECEAFVQDKNEKLIPIYKKGWEEEVSRTTNDGTQYSYGNILFTSNKAYPQDGAFYKRCDLRNFPSEGRQTEESKKEFSERFNYYNNTTNDFAKKFPAIGDYITFYVWSHPEFFSNNKGKTHDEFRNLLIDSLIDYSGVNPDDYLWLKESVSSEKDIRDGDMTVLNQIRQMILKETEKFSFQNADNKMQSYFRNKENDENDLYFMNTTKEQQVEYLMYINHYDYLDFSDYEGGRVGITRDISAALSNFTNGRYNDTASVISGMFGVDDEGNSRWRMSQFNGKRKYHIVFTKDEFDCFIRGEWE